MLAAYMAVAVFATWPLAIHPLDGFYGFGNDNWGGIPLYGWLHDAYLGPGDPSFDPDLQAPFGLDLPEHAIQPLDRLFSLLFGGFGQGLGAYNAQIFSSFVLAGCTMYLFARYLTGSRLAALIAGFIFTFSPFHLAVAMQYNALASIQWIPLYLFALTVLLRRQGRREAVLTGAVFALVAATSYYYAWLIGWFTLLLVSYLAVAGGIRLRRNGAPLGVAASRFARLALSRAAIAAAVAVLLAGPLLLTSARGAAEAGAAAVEHPINEAVRYSARPWMFFIPPHDNPFAGEKVRLWVTLRLFDSPVYEQSIYLGYTALVLALVAFWRTRGGTFLPGRARFARELFLVGALAGGLIMMGPYLPLDRDYWRLWATPDATTHLPSLGWVMFELTPVFRFFVRAFVLVSASLAVLAAIGFARLERRPQMTPIRRAALGTIVLALIALEYTNAPPHVWFSANTPAWVEAVRKLPQEAAVVDYPIATANSPRSLYYMFWQTEHRRKTANPFTTPEAQTLAATIGSPDDPAAGEALHRAGFDYAVVHTRLPSLTRPPYQPGLPDDSLPSDTGSSNPWFRVVDRTADAVIYRVLAEPREQSVARARPESGFGAPEPEAGTRARWLEQKVGRLTVFTTGARRPLVVAVTAVSFAQPRRVAVRFDGRLIRVFEVSPGGYQTTRIPLGSPSSGRHTIELEPRPGPQSIRATTGSPDPRSVSIRVREPIAIGSP